MQTSETAANQSNVNPSQDNANNSTSELFGLTPSELRLISHYRKGELYALASLGTAARSQLEFTALAESLRQSIYDLQTMLTHSGLSFTKRSREMQAESLRRTNWAWNQLIEIWNDVCYEPARQALEDLGDDNGIKS